MDDSTKNMFLEAYDKYADAIYRHCFFHIFSSSRAEELAQETFFKTWQYIENGNKVENIRAFLYRVANNLIIDETRKKKEESLDALMEEPNVFEPSYDGSAKIQRQAMAKEIMTAMDLLPAQHREVLVLRYIDDLDPKEMAEILNTNANTVSVRINRALAFLKDQMRIN